MRSSLSRSVAVNGYDMSVTHWREAIRCRATRKHVPLGKPKSRSQRSAVSQSGESLDNTEWVSACDAAMTSSRDKGYKESTRRTLYVCKRFRTRSGSTSLSVIIPQSVLRYCQHLRSSSSFSIVLLVSFVEGLIERAARLEPIGSGIVKRKSVVTGVGSFVQRFVGCRMPHWRDISRDSSSGSGYCSLISWSPLLSKIR